MGLVARHVEAHGIATVCLSLLREVAEIVRPPRTLYVEFGWGQPFGTPGDHATHEAVARAALALLTDVTRPGTIVAFGAPSR
ncbi:MAG: hypothetical protein U1E76_01680 [Planctomycetota bacterium]